VAVLDPNFLAAIDDGVNGLSGGHALLAENVESLARESTNGEAGGPGGKTADT
jgi:hypothetical protein